MGEFRDAREGQIIDSSGENGIVSAAVQGSRADPCEIRIQGDALDEATWAGVERAMADRAVFAARLLAERCDDDPFLISRRRGRSRNELLENLQ